MQDDLKIFFLFPVLILNFIARDKVFIENYVSKYTFYTTKVQEQSIKYLGKYSAKCMKSKVFPY